MFDMSVSIDRVTFEHHRQALGIGESQPSVSWRFEGGAESWEQAAYQLEVVREHAQNVFTVNSTDSLFVPWPDAPLQSREQATLRVRAIGKADQPATPWSDWVSVETGLLDGEWSGIAPIAADREFNVSAPKEPVYFRREFDVGSKRVKRARLYITALGIYEAEINGQRVGDHVLAPGFQAHDHRHVYDTHDVTDLLAQGDNAIGVVVAEGWYSGRIYSSRDDRLRNYFGDTLGALAILIIDLEDGTEVKVVTDPSWKASLGPITDAELFNGEKYDSRLEENLEGWSTPSFSQEDDSWISVKERDPPKGVLTPPDGPPVRRLEEVKPIEFFKSPSGKQLVDFGQNLVGFLRISVEGPRGTNISFRHAEVLEFGELGIRPLRTADQLDILILHGNGPQVYEPRFTFHGFRYVQIDGWPEDETPLTADALTAVVVYSDMERTGYFECSHPGLNRFHQNVWWSMKGNFVSIPTDCPQRDERAGWTGDATIFNPTSNYLYDTAGFWRSWHKDIWSEMQAVTNMVVSYLHPMVPPDGVHSNPGRSLLMPTAIWGDVAVSNSWNLFKSFGNAGLLREMWPQAYNWMEKGIPRNEDGLWNRTTFQFGDWLDPLAPPESPGQGTTAAHLVADAYLVGMTEMMSWMAAALGSECQAQRYARKHEELRQLFLDAWTSDGQLANRTQTAYALGLHFDLFEEDQTPRAVETFLDIVAKNEHRIGTGFAGTPLIGSAFLKGGAVQDFYKMLLQTEVPSWLYAVEMGGTTTWERWDSMLPNGTINPGQMTSFNHYAFGSVAQWMHAIIGGISPLKHGWKKVAVAPVPGPGITSANATFVSGYGKIQSRWWVGDDGFHLEVTVPPNSAAVVTLPDGRDGEEVGSGFHTFHAPEYELPASL